jgi:hypothetical protein
MAGVEEVSNRLRGFDPVLATFTAADRPEPEQVAAALRSYGCAWIKGTFDPKALGRYDAIIAHNIEGIEETCAALGLNPLFNVGFPLYFASEANRTKAQGLFKSTYPQMFDPSKMQDADTQKLARFVFDSMHACNLAVRTFLGMERLYTSAALCHIRNFKPREERWLGEFHQDNKLYRSSAQILTLWFPFRYQHGLMASLEFLPVSLDSHLPTAAPDGCGIDNSLFVDNQFWRPAYELGDAMLLTGFVPHRNLYRTRHDAGAH